MYLVFTDVDGTLLDHDTYSYAPAREGISLLFELRIPLVLVSSKTLPEMKQLHEELSLSAPFIFENGGGIFWPGKREAIEYIGMDISQLKTHAPLLGPLFQEEVKFITDMDIDEIVKTTALPRARAVLSQQRRSSLPFVLPSGRKISTGEIENINNDLRPLGFAVTRGGRFFHFSSVLSEKGAAVKKVVAYYYRQGCDSLKTIGVGDSENDLSMFRAVDLPVVVRRPDGSSLRTGMANIIETSGIGPSGFTEAVKLIIKGEK